MTPLPPAEAQARYQNAKHNIAPVDQTRLEAVLAKLDAEGKTTLAEALAQTFPDKTGEDAQTAFRQLRERLRKLEVGLKLEVQDLRRTTPDKRLVWFERSAQGDDVFKRFTDAETKLPITPIATKGVRRVDLNKIKIDICVRGGREDEASQKLSHKFLLELQKQLEPIERFVFHIEHAEDTLLGADKAASRRQKFQQATLVLALLSPQSLAQVPSLREEYPYGMDFVVPVLLNPLDEKRHEWGDFRGRNVFRYKQKAISQIPVKELPEAALSLMQHLYEFVENSIEPLAKEWELNQAVVQAFANELKTPRYTNTEGARVKLSTAEVRSESIRQDSFAFLDAWLERPSREPFMALLGEYGMGKTTTLKNWCQHRLALWQEDKSQPLPIYINLNHLNSVLLEERSRLAKTEAREETASKRLFQLSAEELLDNVLESIYKNRPNFERLYAKDVIAKIQNEGAILVLDSLDEVLVHLTETGGADLLRKLQLLLPFSKWLEPDQNKRQQLVRIRKDGGTVGCMVIACRTHYFSSFAALSNRLFDQQRRELSGDYVDAFMLYPFRKEQMLAYFAENLPERNPEEVFDLLQQIHNLPDLMSRPYHLDLIAEQIAELEAQRAAGSVVNAASLYNNIVRSSLGRDDTRHWLQPHHKQELLEEVAWQLHEQGATHWQIEDLQAWFLELLENRPKWQRELRGEPSQIRDQLKEDLRTAMFLVLENPAQGLDEHFRFAHRSMFEYFLAKALYRALLEQNTSKWETEFVSDETYGFLEQLLMLATPAEQKKIPACWEKIKQNHEATPQMLTFVFARLARERKAEAKGRRLPNCPLPNLARGDYSCIDFTQITQRYALAGTEPLPLNMAGSNLSHAVLAGLTIRNLNLTHSDLSNADLRHSRWVNTQTQAAKWEQLNGLNALRMTSGLQKVLRQAGHKDSLRSIRFAPDGKRIVSGSGDNSISVWEVDSGTQLMQLKGHKHIVTSISFSFDGLRILSGSFDKSIRIWDATSGIEIMQLNGHQDYVWSVAFSPDGTKIVSGSSDTFICVWDAVHGTELMRLNGHRNYVWSVAFSPDNTKIVSGSKDKSIRIWDAISGTELMHLNGHEDYVWGVTFSPDGKTIVSGSEEDSIRVWDAVSGFELMQLGGHQNWILSVAFSPDGNKFITGSEDDSIRIWDTICGFELMQLAGHQNWVWSVVFSPDGTKILSGSYDRSIRVWDAISGAQLLQLEGHQGLVWSVAFSPDGTKILSGSYDKSIRVWDAISGIQLLQIEGHQDIIRSIAFSPDGTKILSGSYDGFIYVWDAISGTQLLQLEGHQGSVSSIAFSPDGSRICSGSGDNSVCVWDAVSGTQLLQLEGHQSMIWSIAFSPDGSRICSGSGDNSICVWDAVSGTQLFQLEGHQSSVRSVAFSPDGSSIISASGDGWILWELPQANTTLDPYGILHAPDCKRVICGMSMGANPALGVPDTIVVLDLLENKILHKHGDWWRLVRRVWWDEDGQYHSIAETALMQPWQQLEP
jgi:WD40 repeat protein